MSHQPKAEIEANKEKKAKKDNIWTADANWCIIEPFIILQDNSSK